MQTSTLPTRAAISKLATWGLHPLRQHPKNTAWYRSFVAAASTLLALVAVRRCGSGLPLTSSVERAGRYSGFGLLHHEFGHRRTSRCARTLSPGPVSPLPFDLSTTRRVNHGSTKPTLAPIPKGRSPFDANSESACLLSTPPLNRTCQRRNPRSVTAETRVSNCGSPHRKIDSCAAVTARKNDATNGLFFGGVKRGVSDCVELRIAFVTQKGYARIVGGNDARDNLAKQMTKEADRAKARDHSYCCVSLETIDLSRKIRAWVKARESEGWTVEFSVREDPSFKLGVMWQCVKHDDGRHEHMEFTPCISM